MSETASSGPAENKADHENVLDDLMQNNVLFEEDEQQKPKLENLKNDQDDDDGKSDISSDSSSSSSDSEVRSLECVVFQNFFQDLEHCSRMKNQRKTKKSNNKVIATFPKTRTKPLLKRNLRIKILPRMKIDANLRWLVE